MEGKGNMERLTSYEGDYKREMICRYEDCDTCEEYCPDLNADNCPCLQEILEKLAEYEDLEEQGKLLKLPCKLGDTAFWISDEDENGNKIPTVREDNPIVGIAIQEDGLYILADGDDEYQKVGTRWAFLTRESAEAALKEMGE